MADTYNLIENKAFCSNGVCLDIDPNVRTRDNLRRVRNQISTISHNIATKLVEQDYKNPFFFQCVNSFQEFARFYNINVVSVNNLADTCSKSKENFKSAFNGQFNPDLIP